MARSVTSLTATLGDRIVVVAPHADDDVLGAGGLIARAADEGADVIVLCVALGDTYFPHQRAVIRASDRRDELDAGLRVLDNGHGRVRSLTLYPDKESYLDTIPIRDVITALDKLIFEERPTALLMPCPSVHQDHEIVFRASMAACRPSPGLPLRFVGMHEYPAAVWNHHALPEGRIYVDVTAWIELKRRALECHRSQLREPEHLASADTMLHWSRGHARAAGFAGHAEVIRPLRWRV
jgi:LmbE family N-acetylglucosaminyl deacetylase